MNKNRFHFKIEKDPTVVTKLNEPVQNYHATQHPDVFLRYNYELLLPWFVQKMEEETVTAIVAYDEVLPIGYVLLIDQTLYNSPYVKPGLKIFTVDQMSIDPVYQNKGIGAQLMDFVLAYCREQGAIKVRLTVWADNEQAKHFYRKMGFECTMEHMNMNL